MKDLNVKDLNYFYKLREEIKIEYKQLIYFFDEKNNIVNRFKHEHNDGIKGNKKQYETHKALAKTSFSNNRHEIRKVISEKKQKLDSLKKEYKYEVYELTELQKASIDKNNLIYKNRIEKFNKEIAHLKYELDIIIKKNQNPEDYDKIEEFNKEIDKYKLSIVSIKKQYRLDKVRQLANLGIEKISISEKNKKRKEIKQTLIKVRDEEVLDAKNKINNIHTKINELKSKKTNLNQDQVNNINIRVLELEKQKIEFETEALKFVNEEKQNIIDETKTKINLVTNNYNEDRKITLNYYNTLLSNLTNKEKKQSLGESKKSNIIESKKYKENLKDVKKLIKQKEKTNKAETKQLLEEVNTKIKAIKTNVQSIRMEFNNEIKRLRSEYKIKDSNSEDKELLIAIEQLNKEVKHDSISTNKVIMQKRANRVKGKINIAYIFIAPAVFGAVVFTVLPLIFMVVAAFFRVDIVNLSQSNFVGFYNFYNIFTNDIQFKQSLSNTLIFSLITVGLLSVVTLLMAAWLSKNTKIHNAVTTMVFTPHIASLVAISILWIALLAPQGIINQALAIFGIEGPRWLLQESTSLLSVSMVTVWKDIGYYVLLIIAGLQGIPSYVYEAAKLDKSKKAKTFFRITVPLLGPTLSFVFVNKFINSFKVFAAIEIMTNGGPMGSSTVLSYWIYKVGRLGFNYGQAMAGAIVLTLIITVFTIINFKFFNKRVEY